MILHATFSLAAIGMDPERARAALCAEDTDLMACVHAVAASSTPRSRLVIETRIADGQRLAERLELTAEHAERLDGLALVRDLLERARAHARRAGQLTIRVAVKSREAWWRELFAGLRAWWRKATAQ